jgi:hypothetical protein
MHSSRLGSIVQSLSQSHGGFFRRLFGYKTP